MGKNRRNVGVMIVMALGAILSVNNASIASASTATLENSSLIKNSNSEELTIQGGNEDVIEESFNLGLPQKYSSLDLGYVTSLKNQGSYGSCWSFATIACAETNLIKKGMADLTIDLSELQLAYFAYHPKVDALGGTRGDTSFFKGATDHEYLNNGGNFYMATSTLANWMGVVKEKYVPYEDAINGVNDIYAYDYDVAHLANVEYIPVTQFTKMKEHIMEYGAGGISYKSSTSFYNAQGDNYYYPAYGNGGEGHAVTVIGWDDNYSKENFKYEPEGDGAWLIKNSWGDSKGYFWLSYYDFSLESKAAFFDFEKADNYDYQYQYDGAISSNLFYYWDDTNDNHTRIANCFVSTSIQSLDAIAFETYKDATHYYIQVYKDMSVDGDPTSGKEVFDTVVSGVKENEGYYTVSLDKEIILKKGERYAISVTYYREGGEAYFPFENSKCSSAQRGQTYVYVYGDKHWYDIKDYKERVTEDGVPQYDSDGKELFVKPLVNSNAKIKAFTSKYLISDMTMSGMIINKYPLYVNYGQKLSDNMFDIDVVMENGTKKKIKLSECFVEGYSERNAGKQKVTLTYDNGVSNVSSVGIYVKSIKLTKPVIKSIDYNTLSVKWRCDLNINSYDVYRVDVTTGKATLRGTVVSNLVNSDIEYKDKVVSGKYYTYYVMPSASKLGVKENSVARSVLSNKTRAVVFAPVINETVCKNYKTNSISWSRVIGANGYYVYRRSEGTGYVKIASRSGNLATSFTDTKVISGVKYYYAIKAYRTVSKENVLSSFSKSKAVITKPGKTVITTKKSSNRKVTLTWNAVAGASGYEVYVYNTSSHKYVKRRVTSALVRKCVDGPFVKGRTYSYKVRAYRVVKGKKVYGAFSNVAKIRIN